MLELAHVGANVLHPRSVETAKQYQVPLRVRSTFKLDDLGTYIIGVDDMEINKPVAGVAADLSQIRVVITEVPDKPGNAAKIFEMLSKSDISVDMIIQSYGRSDDTNDIAFTVSETDYERTMQIVKEIIKEINASGVLVDEDIAKVSIVGAGMVDRPGIAASMFKALAEKGINIKMISTSEIKISCLVQKNQSKEAIKALHTAFHLDAKETAVVMGDLPDV